MAEGVFTLAREEQFAYIKVEARLGKSASEILKALEKVASEPVLGYSTTVQILCIGTDRSQQTVQTKIRLLLKKQSDQGLRCLPVHQHLLDALMQFYV